MDFLKWARENRLPSALQSRQGWASLFEHHRSSDPHIHQIEPTNACPYSCIMCPRETHMHRGRGLMDISLYQGIIDEIAGFSSDIRKKEIELFHFGESLLHPKIADMAGYASNAGLRPVLSVNPVELTPKLTDALLERAPWKIIVSLDSMQDHRYKAIRGQHANREIAIRHTEYLLKRHAGMDSKTIVRIRMIVMNINQDEAEDFKIFWEARGAEVELRDFFPWSKKDLLDLGTVEKYPPGMPCPFPWQYMVVQWNGDVVACCRDYDGRLKLGNVREQSLREIWNGPAYELFRKQMAGEGELCGFCRECLDIYYQEPEESTTED